MALYFHVVASSYVLVCFGRFNISLLRAGKVLSVAQTLCVTVICVNKINYNDINSQDCCLS